eukprot:gb/GEZN01010068.1/.p1 GENE.gb/GEZN01010068.1/~~gb/GEZN01010068.1/.p1  ORF type:complete len:311 (+),score=5.28 gb/GEZN01010068.1/:177-1109(+)
MVDQPIMSEYSKRHAILFLVLVLVTSEPATKDAATGKFRHEICKLFSQDDMAVLAQASHSWFNNLTWEVDARINSALGANVNHLEDIQYGHKRFDVLGPIGPTCKKLESYGAGDGEKRACGLSILHGNDCLVISVGSSNSWEFEEAIFDQLPLCRIVTLDCTGQWSPPNRIQSRTQFFNVCIGQADTGKFLSYDAILKMLNRTSAPSFLKIDVEGFEWDVVRSFRSSHEPPVQIAMELHYQSQMPQVSWHNRLKTSPEIAMLMKYLHELNYFIVNRRDNILCPHCSEILLVNLRSCHLKDLTSSSLKWIF